MEDWVLCITLGTATWCRLNASWGVERGLEGVGGGRKGRNSTHTLYVLCCVLDVQKLEYDNYFT